MISTRSHGMIDYAVATLLGSLSRRGSLPPRVRRILGVASLGHAGYAAMTDYEGGVQPRLSMRQHLALDALGGAGLLAAGLFMRSQPVGARALLVALAVSELSVVAVSSATPLHGPGQGSGPVQRLLAPDASPSGDAGYPPLDTPKPVAEGVFMVDSLPDGVMGAILPVRMTVIRLPDGGLLLHSPTRFSYELKQKLEAIGPIRHLVAPNIAHWIFLRAWQDGCPGVITWAAPGLRERSQVKRAGVRIDHDLDSADDLKGAEAEWGGDIALIVVPGGLGWREITLFHQPTRTLVLTDLVLNLQAQRLPAVLRPLARLFGVLAPDGMPPPYLRAAIKLQRKDAAYAASQLLALQPERVIFAHGSWFAHDATASLRRSLRWLLP